MPKPNKKETKQEFLSRCIPILIGEGKKQKQAVAICESMYDAAKEEEQMQEMIDDGETRE